MTTQKHRAFILCIFLFFMPRLFASLAQAQNIDSAQNIDLEELYQDSEKALISNFNLDTTMPTKYPQLSLEIPENKLIKNYKTQYTSSQGLSYLSTVMQRSSPYRDYILDEIKKQNAPEFLLYLPVIESSFSVHAISKSGATGIWQFMKNSISGYGIRINDWMDERKDPWLSSVAAIRKLQENYNDLGDWYLALAAYNCGLGATRTAIKKAGKADYWYLCEKGYFKTETVHYVPKFLAIAEILSQSDTYEIDWGDSSLTPEYVTIPVKRAVDLRILSKETNTDSELLKQANPALFYAITPPDASYNLRIPKTDEAVIREALSDPKRKFLEYYIYKIKSGDTLYALSKHYGISSDMILEYNPGTKPSSLKIGQTLMIPALKEVKAYAGKKDPENLNFSGTYLVKQGDTLWSIALAYGIQVETLAEKNNIEVNGTLKLGKALVVPII